MITNKDFKEFRKFLEDQKQYQINEGPLSSALKTGIKMATGTAAVGGGYSAADAARRGGSKEDVVKAGIEGAKSIVTEPVRKAKEKDYWGATTDVITTVNPAAAGLELAKMGAETDIGRKIGKAIGDYVPGAKAAAETAKKFRSAIGMKSSFEPEVKDEPKAETPKAPEEPKPINTDISKSLTPDYSSYAKSKQFKTSDEESGGKKKMTDKKKSISEALAEVQHYVNEIKLPKYRKLPDGKFEKIPELKPDTSVGKTKLTPETPKSSGGGSGTTPPSEPPKGTEKAPEPPKDKKEPAPAPEKPKPSLGKEIARGGLAGLALGAGVEALKGFGVIGGKSDDEASKAEAPSTEAPKTETPKSSPETKQTFKQAFAAARQAAAEKGKKATGQFEYDGKKYQTNLAPAKGAEKYVSMGKQTKVDVSQAKAPEAPKAAPAPAPKATSIPSMASPETAPPMRMPKSIGGETEKAPEFQIKMPWDTESGGKTKGKKKMSEEHIDEMTPFEKTFAQKMKQLGTGKTYRDPGTGKDILLKYGQNKPKAPGQSVPKAAGPKGPQDNPGLRSANPQFLRPRTDKPLSSISPGRDPAKIDYSKNNQGKPETLPSTARDSAEDPARGVQRLPGGGEKGVGTPGGTLSLERPSQTPKVSSSSDSGLVSNRPRPGQEAPGAAASNFVRRELGQSPMKSDSSPPPASTPSSSIPPSMKVPASMSGADSSKNVVGSPTSRFGFGSVSSVGRMESGGKKKMKESTGNPFIDSFLELQNTKAGNVFEAAKKLSDKQKKIASLAGHPGKIDAEDFKALRAGKKMEEADNSTSSDYLGAGAVTSTPAKSSKPSTASKPAAPRKTSSDYQGSGEVTMDSKPVRVKNEEVSFSDEEIAHLNSVLEAFAPEAPEENMSDGVSKKMDRKTLTDSKKVK